MHGQSLWLLINEVVLLTENYQAAQDPRYVELTNHVHTGHARRRDFDDLHSRLISKVSEAEIERFRDAPLVTADKMIRDVWNLNAVKSFAARTGEAMEEYLATDSIEGKPTSGPLKATLLDLPSSRVHCDFLGKLPLVKGMRVMILQNILTELGVVNGADGMLEDVLFDIVDGARVATAAFVRIPGSGIQMTGLPPDVVLILPQSESKSVDTKAFKQSFTRSQLPILPVYAMTDYKSQGQSLKLVILDLASSGHRLESAYVMVSRATALDNLLLLRDFDISRICRRQNDSTYSETKRLESLEAESHCRYFQRRS